MWWHVGHREVLVALIMKDSGKETPRERIHDGMKTTIMWFWEPAGSGPILEVRTEGDPGSDRGNPGEMRSVWARDINR